MNPELIKITLENKAILDAFKAQLEIQKTTATSSIEKSNKFSSIWKIVLLGGVAIIGYKIIKKYIETND